MGLRGPAPKPTALKILQGNPGKRRLNQNEPKPALGMPRCPAWLDDEAKACWKRIVPQLQAMGVLTLIDADALTNYCDTWSRWKKAVLFIQKNGDVYVQKDESGAIKYIQQLPQVAIARNLLAVLNRYQQEFGLTPAARTRLTIAEQDDSPGLMEFLGFGAA
jgi:P27 family predicted phage terminase small subunit